VTRRIAEVEALLTNFKEQGQLRAAGIRAQIDYLQRLLRTQTSPEAASMQSQVDALRHRLDLLLEASPQILETLSDVASNEADPVDGVYELGCSRHNSNSSCTIANQFATGPSVVAPLASFLYPEQPQEQAEDEVRLIAAGGQLTEVLSCYPTMSVPGTQSALIMRKIQTFTDEDAEEFEQHRERLALLELAQTAANLREVTILVNEEVVSQQPLIDEVEEQMDTATENVHEAVAHLQTAGQHRIDRLKWIAPSVGIVLLGGGAVAVGGAAAAGCAACVVLRVGLLGSTLAIGGIGTRKVHKWQTSALNSMTKELPRAFDPMPTELVHMLAYGGQEVQRRLLSKLEDRSKWIRWTSLNAASRGIRGLQAWHRPSDARAKGSACLASFRVQRPVLEAFRCLQQIALTGSLDPGCEVVWSRPIGSAATGTSLRYLIFSDWPFPSRDFYCVCRCAVVELACSDGVEEQPQLAQQYVFAVMSLTPELLEGSGLPLSNNGIQHGNIHISGILLTNDGSGGCKVDVMGDVNPEVASCIPSVALDLKLLDHVLDSAGQLAHQLLKRD